MTRDQLAYALAQVERWLEGIDPPPYGLTDRADLESVTLGWLMAAVRDYLVDPDVPTHAAAARP